MIFDHIGLFVSDLREGREKLAALLPIAHFSEEIADPILRVRIQFGVDASNIRYELVAALGEDSPVTGVLASGKNILNHVAYRVPSLDEAMERLRRQRAIPLGPPAPALAFGGRKVVFFLTPLKFILELIEDIHAENHQ